MAFVAHALLRNTLPSGQAQQELAESGVRIFLQRATSNEGQPTAVPNPIVYIYQAVTDKGSGKGRAASNYPTFTITSSALSANDRVSRGTCHALAQVLRDAGVCGRDKILAIGPLRGRIYLSIWTEAAA
jgi:hypothetical protein